jgi:4-amino-4-deoxy-L-arabinose transferase-like glycosyltransferase
MLSSPSRVLALILVAGCALRIVPIWFGLPYSMARPDEETALGHAVAVMRGDLNPQFFHWPSLIFYVFGSVFAAVSYVSSLFGGGEPPRETLVLIGRGLVALFGTASIYVLYRLTRTFADRPVALVAAALFAVAMLHVRESHFAMTDVLMTLLLLVALTLVLHIGTRPAGSDGLPRRAAAWSALAGLIAGLATSTKYNAAAVAASMAAAQLAWFASRPRLALSLRGWLPSLAFAILMGVGFLAATPYALLDSPKFVEDFRFTFSHLSEGHAGLDLGRGWYYHLRYSLPHGLGVTAFIAAVIGLLPFLRGYGRAAWILGAFACGFYAVVGSGYTVFYRYVLPLIPLVCIPAAIGTRLGAERLQSWLGLSPGKALAVAVTLAVGPGLVHSVWFDAVLSRTDTRVLAADWLGERVRPDDSLHDAGGNYTRLDLGRIDYHPWLFDPAASNFGDPEGRTPTWIVLYDSPLTAYTPIPPYLRRLTTERYDLVHQVRATGSGARRATYDHQDAFFVPVNGFYTVVRPGPNVKIYRRRD